MSDQGLIMSGPMVRAMLAGRKTMTRRLPWHWLRYHTERPGHTKRFTKATWEAAMKERSPFTTIDLDGSGRRMAFRWTSAPLPGQDPRAEALWIAEPICQPGESLWIKETWQLHARASDVVTVVYAASINGPWSQAHEQFPARLADGIPARPFQEAWRSSLHQARWASRLTLAVRTINLEPIQSITEADAIAEGIENIGLPDVPDWRCYMPEPKAQDGWTSPRESFRTLWQSLHGNDSWYANPVVIAFSGAVHQANIDKIERAAA